MLMISNIIQHVLQKEREIISQKYFVSELKFTVFLTNRKMVQEVGPKLLRKN